MNFEFKSVEELQAEGGRAYGKFGLNKGTNLVGFDYAEGDYGPTLTVEFKVEEASYKRFISPVTKVWAKEGGEIQPGHAQYESNKKIAEEKIILWVNQVAEAITSKEVVKQALATPPANIVEYFKLMERVVKSNPAWQTKPLDLFLQYQYAPRPGYTVTFLEVPKPDNLKNGNLVFVTAEQPGTFTESRDSGLKYKDEAGKLHPIKRTAFFLTQGYSKPVTATAPSEGVSQFAIPTPGNTAPDTGSW